MKCSIQLGFASLNRTFHLSPHENISTIALITIHYLYTIQSSLEVYMLYYMALFSIYIVSMLIFVYCIPYVYSNEWLSNK